MSWATEPLQNVATFTLGKMLDAEKNRGEFRPYLANVNVRWGEFELSDLREMRFQETELDRFGLKYGDIVMCEGGEPGRCAIWKEQLPAMMVQKALHRIRAGDKLDYRFLYYVFLFQGRIGAFSGLFTGATIKHLPKDKLAQIQVPVPPLPTQRRIADILSAYDDLIENNTRRIAILEYMARRLFEEWFGRDAVSGEAEPVRIDALIDFDPKTKVAKEGWKPFLPMPCVPTNSMAVSQWEEREGNAGSKFLNGDTLLARITPCLENGKTAFVDFLPEGTAGFGSTEFIVMRGRVVPPEFVYCLARSDAFREHAIKSMSGATGRQRVSSAAVAQFEIASPHPERLEKFGEAARPMFAMVRSLANANTNLRTTRDLLLPKLISGQIEVRTAEEELEAAAA